MPQSLDGTSCPICQGEIEPKVLGKASLGGDTCFDLVECQTCFTRYLSPLPSPQQLQAVYLPNYYGSDWYKQKGWGSAFAKLELARKEQGKFLDVGCGLGFFIDGIKQNSNWEVYGVEFSEGAADFARNQLGLNVRQGELVDIGFPDAFFDYIQVHNVLEHVTDPITLLKECRRILKADGLLDLRVPNGRVDSLDLLEFYRDVGEVPFSKSGHVFFFPKQALLWMFEEVGLTAEQSRTYGIRRGLASLGFWPRLSNWKRHYLPRPHNENDGNSTIALPPNKNRPGFYYSYRLLRMRLRMLPGLREFGLDFEVFLRRKPSATPDHTWKTPDQISPSYSSVLKLAVQKARYSVRGRFSHSDEEQLIGKFLQELLPQNGARTVVDIGAGNGVRWSNSYALLKSGWKVLGVEADPEKYQLLSRVYSRFPRAHACHSRANLENIRSLLKEFDIDTDFAVLCLDIDGNDYWILDAILRSYRPTLVVTEINEKIPPPIRFAVKYDPEFSLRHHFYGYSIATLSDLCARHGYGILQLEYNNAFLAPLEIGAHFIDAETAYAEGYRDRPNRKQRFPPNFDMEAVLSLSPQEGLEFLREFYAKEDGKYYLGLEADTVPTRSS